MFEVTLEIPESDLELGYNHVNHAKTLLFLERARILYLEHIGYPNDRLISEGLFLVIARIDVQYKREIFSGKYSMTVEDARIVGKALLMRQRVLNDRGKECVSADFDFRLIDGKTKRSTYLPHAFTALI